MGRDIHYCRCGSEIFDEMVKCTPCADSLDRVVRCGKRHSLKTWPEFFEKIADGTKTFELRKDDRGFEVGDELILVEYSPVADCVTGRKVIRRVTYIMRGPSFGLDAGWCVMALAAPTGADERPAPARKD